MSGSSSSSSLNSRSVAGPRAVGSVVNHLEFGHHGRTQIPFGQQLLRRLVDRLLQDLGRDRPAKTLANDRHRHLAGPETGQIDLFGEFRQARHTAGFNIRRRHHHRECALEAVGKCLGHLHLPIRSMIPLSAVRAVGPRPRSPALMVRAEGFEPPRLAPPEPKSGVSANSTTPADCPANLGAAPRSEHTQPGNAGLRAVTQSRYDHPRGP